MSRSSAMASAALQFDPVAHTYEAAGKRLPSVTQVLGILNDWSGIPPAVLEAARDFGANLHAAINLYNRGELDKASVDAPLVPYLDGWEAFLDQSGAVVIASEQPVYHPSLGYAGTPDVVLDWNGRIVVPDIKSTHAVPRTVGPQTAAYAEAWWYTNGARGRRPERYCIHLQDGKYQLHKRNDPADWSMFLSCLNVFKYLEKK